MKYLFIAIPFLFTSSLIATPVDLRLLHLYRAVFSYSSEVEIAFTQSRSIIVRIGA